VALLLMAKPSIPVPRLFAQLVQELALALAARFGVDEVAFRGRPSGT
jgi:hypothetical protein